MELIEGNWYSAEDWKSGSCFRYTGKIKDGNKYYFNESILYDSYRTSEDYWFSNRELIEINPNKIKHLLPKDYKFEEKSYEIY